MINNALYSSNSDEWATPADIYKLLDDEFCFDLDPCASDANHKCAAYFTAEQDGLSQNWGGVESFVTRLIARLLYGLKRHTEKAARIIRLSCCLSRPEQIQNIFTTSYIIAQRSALFEAV